MASGMSQFCSRLVNCCLLNLVPFGSRAGDLSVRPHTGSENFFFLHFHLVLGSRSMRSRLCVAPRAMGFGVGLALPCLWCLIFLFGVSQRRRSGVVVGSFRMMVGHCGVVGSDWLGFVVLGASRGWDRVGRELRSHF